MVTWTTTNTTTVHPIDYVMQWQVYVEGRLKWEKAKPIEKSVDMKTLKEKYGDLYE